MIGSCHRLYIACAISRVRTKSGETIFQSKILTAFSLDSIVESVDSDHTRAGYDDKPD